MNGSTETPRVSSKICQENIANLQTEQENMENKEECPQFIFSLVVLTKGP